MAHCAFLSSAALLETMSETKSVQGSRVQQELEALRSKQLAKSRRDKLKDFCSPLTTPEEAQAFLASMRDKQHQRDKTHQPPTHLSADGVDAWYRQQKQRDDELKRRRKEAEALLRGYRGSIGSYQQQTPMSPDHSTAHRETIDAETVPVMDLRNEFQDAAAAEEKKEEEDRIPQQTASGDTEPSLPHEILEETIWREFVSPDGRFPPAAGRYHLYCSYACPGSHRALIVRALKGLESVISVTFVHPAWRLTNPEDPEDKHRGWVFGDPFGAPFQNTIGRGGPFPAAYANNDPDPVMNAFSIRELYEYAGDTSGKYTIPMLWDKQENTIVNNESSDIAYMINSCFNDFAAAPDLDLYTEYDQQGMTRLNEVSEWLSPLMINGVYRCGFAKTQRAYDKAIDELCLAFDRADDILQQQRYLTGDTLTDADIRLFVTLLRFDEVYAFYFKANARLVMLTPSLLNFCRDIFQMQGVAETCDMEQIKAHFFASHAEWNKYSVIPRGLGFMELLDMPHHRELSEA